MQLGVDRRHVGQPDVVAGGHRGKHGRHVVQEKLDRPHPPPSDHRGPAHPARAVAGVGGAEGGVAGGVAAAVVEGGEGDGGLPAQGEERARRGGGVVVV